MAFLIHLGFLLVSASSAAQSLDGGLNQFVGSLLQKAAIAALKDKTFEIKEKDFQGTLTAVDPDKNVKIVCHDLSLGNDTLQTKVKGEWVFRVKGKVLKDGASTDVRATVKLEITPTARGMITKTNGNFFVKPNLLNLDFKIEIRELDAPGLSGGKELLSTILNEVFLKRREEILKQINKALIEIPLRF